MKMLRRIVTGHNEQGRSKVLFDGPPPQIILDQVAELWFTEQTPADNSDNQDVAIRPSRMLPPAGGSIFRYIVVPPEQDHAAGSAEFQKTLERLDAVDTSVDTSRHPGMHRTPTIDYLVLLQGRVTMLLDESEVDLEPFDLVIQRGTNHAWVNRGKEPALILAVNIDAAPL